VLGRVDFERDLRAERTAVQTLRSLTAPAVSPGVR
jgi:hypothetical protein